MGKGPQFCAAALKGVKVVIIFADGYTDLDQLPLKPTWMKPYQEQALEQFVADGGSFMPLHNSMWGYPIGVHLDGSDPRRWDKMAAELKQVQEKLIASNKPTTTEGERHTSGRI